jgi:hypothetical protein
MKQEIGKRIEIIPTIPNKARVKPPGAKMPLFDSRRIGPPKQDVSFSGRGFMPDLMSDHGYTMMPEASRTTLENEGVYGREGMLPPAGILPAAQSGQKPDEGAAGAGSFADWQGFASKG